MRTNLQLINIHILGGDRSTRKRIIFSLTLLLPDLSAMGTSTNVLLQEKHHHFKRAVPHQNPGSFFLSFML